MARCASCAGRHRAQAGAAVLVLEGLLPARDYLIDLPGIHLAAATERHRIARRPSTLARAAASSLLRQRR